jgi:hypothetical protein
VAERPFIDRVDDAILGQCSDLTRLRQQPIRMSIADFRQTSIENRDLCVDAEGRRLEDYDIWALRIERCDMMLADPNEARLRARVAEAKDHLR